MSADVYVPWLKENKCHLDPTDIYKAGTILISLLLLDFNMCVPT